MRAAATCATRVAARRVTTAASALATVLALSACGSTDGGDDGAPRAVDRATARTTPTAPTAPGTTSPATATETPPPTERGPLRIQITLGDQRVEAELDDSAAARDLWGQLPVTLEMRDHGSVEKTGRLPSPLSLSGQPAGAEGRLGYELDE